MEIKLRPIAYVQNERKEAIDDNWEPIISIIELTEDIPETTLEGMEGFSHFEIIFYMNQVKDEKAVPQYRHPRNNPDLPKLGTFAQRNKSRPNKLGLTTVEFIKREGNRIWVKYLDAIHGTPILDIKPVMKAFEPKSPVRQAAWVDQIMDKYW